MKLQTISLLATALFIFSCGVPAKTKQSETITVQDTAAATDTAVVDNYMQKVLASITPDSVPVFGYRFIVEGDFDGDGIKEKLVEHYFSSITQQEINKYYDNMPDYDQLVTMAIVRDPYSFALTDNKKIDTLHIASGGQLFGASYMKNEGDLDGDGTDEVSYVIDWADWSSLNTWHIASYKNGKWKDIYTFPIWDWQLPDQPQAITNYGLFVVQGEIINTSNDSINKLLEEDLLAFKGLVRKIKDNQIEVIYRNEEASEDTMLVDLRKWKK